MKRTERESEVSMYWRLMSEVRAAGGAEQTDADTIDEMDVLAQMTEGVRLRALCLETVARAQALAKTGGAR